MYYSRQHKQIKEKDMIYKISLIAGLLILIAAWPLTFILPVSVSFENGFIENAQIAVLLVGALYNIKLIFNSTDKQIAAFHIWCMAVMFFMIFRELSWGRVFYPIALEESGPIFVDMSNYAWKIEVHVFIVLYVLILSLYMLKNLPLMRMLRCRLPWFIIIAILLTVICSYVGDHGIIAGKLKGQIAEELGELAFYTLIPALYIHYNRELSR